MSDEAAFLSEEELLLTRAEAEALLLSHGRKVSNVIRCCVDGAILFLDDRDRPYTAWIERGEKGVELTYDAGWSVRPGAVA